MHGLLRAVCVLIITPVVLAAPPEFTWLNQFAGFPELNLRNVAPTATGFVGSTGTRRLPMKFRAPDGELECHVLIHYDNGLWSTSGNVGAIGDDCGFLGGNFPVRAVIPFGTSTCIGGDFTSLTADNHRYFACNDAQGQWFQVNGLGNGPNSPVEALATDGTNVYVGGSFTQVNSAMAMPLSARHIARTNGFGWELLPTDDAGTSNGVNNTVSAIFLGNGIVFAGVGRGVRRWNPSVNDKWSDLGSADLGFVQDIESNAGLIAAASSSATTWGGQPAGAVSEYDGGGMQWGAVGSSSGINTGFSKLAISQGFFHSTGDFSSIDPEARGVARLNASQEWEAVPDSAALGDFPSFLDIFSMDGELCGVQQGFGTAQLFFGRGITCNDGTRWRGLAQGINSDVRDIVSYGGAVVAGGEFSAAGDEILNYIAQYRDGAWQALGGGLLFTEASGSNPGSVRAMAPYQGQLFVTGLFNQAGGMDIPGLARWNGQSWSAVGEGVNFPGSIMLEWNNLLIITGQSASGLGPILQWDGTNLTEFADLPSPTVMPSAMTVYNGDLIAAYRVGGAAALVRFTGTEWETFTDPGLSFGGDINALLAVDSLLYIGGGFTARQGGQVLGEGVVQWDGSSFSSMGDGLQGGFFGVEDLVAAEGAVIATGWFETSGATNVEKLAYFDGQQWFPLGPGLFNDSAGGVGFSLMIDGSTVYVGGIFNQAGNVWSENIGAFDLRLETIFKNDFEGD